MFKKLFVTLSITMFMLLSPMQKANSHSKLACLPREIFPSFAVENNMKLLGIGVISKHRLLEVYITPKKNFSVFVSKQLKTDRIITCLLSSGKDFKLKSNIKVPL